MIRRINFVQTVKVPSYSEATVKFAENLGFTVKRNLWVLKIENVNGDFEITKIIQKNVILISFCFLDNGQTYVLKYDKSAAEFNVGNGYSTIFTFYITANTEMKKMKEMCVVPYQLQIPSACFQCLKFCHFYKSSIVLPGYDDLKFTYYVKKIGESAAENDIELYIENPYNIQIQGKSGDFKAEYNSSNSIDLLLIFDFYPNVTVTHASALVESRPESVIASQILSNATTLLHKLHSNNRYSDVYFITSEGEKIPSRRCILAEFSDIFVKIFNETSEIPVQITVEDFSADTIQSALNFLYDKNDAINGKKVEVFKFAVKFGIQNLIDFCCSFFEDSVSPSNVCEFIQLAYLHNFEKLKQKCLKILVEKKEEIDPSKVLGLPQNIVVDAFFFKL